MLEWMLFLIPPSPYETKKLEAAGITNATLASYCAWRRTMLMLAFPSLAFWSLSSLSSLGDDMSAYSLFNWMGKILLSLPIFAGLMLVVGSAGALWHWTNPIKSNRWVMVGWLLALGLPFIPAFFPIKYIMDRELQIELSADPASFPAINNMLATLYMIQLVPTFVSIPLGMVKASLRIRGLLPDNALAGWILMVTLPLKAMVFVLGLVLASQLIGDIMLIMAMALFIIGPLVYFWNRKLYTDPIDGDWQEKVQRRQALVSWSGLAGLILICAWLFTADFNGKRIVGKADNDDDPDNDPISTYGNIVRMVFEFSGRTFMATLCFADLFLRAAIANWSSDVQLRGSGSQTINGQHRDDMYTAIQAELKSGTGSPHPPSRRDDEDRPKEQPTKNARDTRVAEGSAGRHSTTVEHSQMSLDVEA
jgi:hypothetical protein